MSKRVRKYCSNCDCGTLQYSEKRYSNGSKPGITERIFLGIVSGGVNEACLDEYWTCTECGERT